jgi:L-2-hydroxyglutarate oxidase
MAKPHFDLLVIGAGVVGLATAYKYQLKYPTHRVAVLEKEERLGAHQTGRNSGVIHSGVYYKPGSYKARLCVDGRKQLVDFARQFEVPHEVCGKVIVATAPEEVPILEGIFERGKQNEIENISLIGPQEIAEIEPHVNGLKAIRVPVTGIIDYVALIQKFAERISAINPSSQLFLNTEYIGSFERGGEAGVHTSRGDFYANHKVFCAGLHADRMAKKEGLEPGLRIVGFRGDYYELTPQAKHKVKHLIYPVPDPAFPFLGVHFTRMTDGSVECGPNAVFSFKREGYSRTAFNWRDTLEALGFSGTWRLFFRHTAKGWDEMRRAFSKALFLKALRKLLPDLQMDDIVATRAGVRAQAILPNGDLVDDFKMMQHGNSTHVLNAPSPAATACLAIADEILRQAGLDQ